MRNSTAALALIDGTCKQQCTVRMALAAGFGLDGLGHEHTETFDEILERAGSTVDVDRQDINDVFSWAKDGQKLFRIAKVVIEKLRKHKIGAVSYVTYVCTIKLISALLLRVKTASAGTNREEINVLNVLLNGIKMMLREFDPDRVSSAELDDRIKEHKNSAFYKTVKKYAKAVIDFFKRLIAKVRAFVSGNHAIDPVVSNPRIFIPAALTKVAALDGMYKNMGQGRVSTKLDADLPVVHTKLLALEHKILESAPERDV